MSRCGRLIYIYIYIYIWRFPRMRIYKDVLSVYSLVNTSSSPIGSIKKYFEILIEAQNYGELHETRCRINTEKQNYCCYSNKS